MAQKQAFGGYQIDFSGCSETLEQLFGTEPITPAEMTSAIWAFVKAHGLATK